MKKSVDLQKGFAVGFFLGIVFCTAVFGLLFYQYTQRVTIEVYTCTMYETRPNAGVLAGLSCFPGNVSNPCFGEDLEAYNGFYMSSKPFIDVANDREENLKMRGYNNSSFLMQTWEKWNRTNAEIEKAINPFD